jgi:thioredoxin reductase/Pyruvate/2-oxoacid:ferredoxin oxidoreductase delta subunit
MNGTTVTYVGFALLLLVPVVLHLRRIRARETRAIEAAERGKLHSSGPRAQHPSIDITSCIGCAACADVCPEGDVLGIIGGKAAIINGHKCIGHGLCADECPVGAIDIVMADPSISGDMPHLTPEYETNVPNMFIIGELGGLALIKNAVNQGRDCIDAITRRLATNQSAGSETVSEVGTTTGLHDVCIVGAGPGGISASLRAIENKLNYVTLEQDEFGGTVSKYPRQKLVMTSPVQLPLYGKFRKLEISKEELLSLWAGIGQRIDLKVRCQERVDAIVREQDGLFTIETPKGRYRARAVVLALGRRGTPRKLRVKGEELPKVMYSLLEAEAYTAKNILVVGGGDSAVEAAMGLAHQKGNRVTLSYRKDSFSRIKERNAQRIQECIRKKVLTVLFQSNPVEIGDRIVRLDVGGEIRDIPNDYVWIFAGGIPPNAFLEKVGIVLGRRDLTRAAQLEAKQAGLAA